MSGRQIQALEEVFKMMPTSLRQAFFTLTIGAFFLGGTVSCLGQENSPKSFADQTRDASPATQANNPPLSKDRIQLPSDTLPAKTLPSVTDRVVPNPLTEKLIRGALNGGLPTETSDPLLQDALGFLRNRGSVLKGSSLDPNLRDDELTTGDSTGGSTSRASENHFLAVELLLRTARVLEKTGSSSPDHRQLVDQMRRHAVTMILESVKK